MVSSAKPPNIVILLADDMGWNDIGVHGSEVPTPNIDALAYNGIVLKRHYAQPSCTPSRSALLSGKYPIRYGLQGYPLSSKSKYGLPTDIKIMPEVLKELGYRTHLVGKWHQGYPTWRHMPTRRGFDSFYGFLNGYLSYYDGVHCDSPSIGLDFRSDEEESWRSAYGKYLPEILSEKASAIVRNHSRHHKNDPLFLLVSMNAPHAGGNRPFINEIPPVRHDGARFIADEKRRIFADVMRYVDDTLGNVTSTLKAEGMLENSLILFLADNGGPSIDPIWNYGNAASNFPFRGTKMSMYEGGVRAAAVLWKSNMVSTPRVYDGLFHITDWLPTLISAAGGSRLEDLDGVDHWSALLGLSPDDPRKELLVEINDQGDSWGYVSGNFKLVKSYNSTYRLSFADNYFSPPPEANPAGYQFQEVTASQVAKAIGVKLNETACLEMREKMTLTQHCTADQMALALQHDCSADGCLYDISEDPSECFDIAKQHPDLARELFLKMKYYQDSMFKAPDLPLNNEPNVRNYFAPSSAKSYKPFTLLTSLVSLASIIRLCDK
ncbi:Arylsulfatase [Nesidiocoris tenuis]|uniref:Arylsulfatase n=1 Tax=Nesidiocoris tenuis TaxID=355587 RepID=A0ABN7ANS9_9HEMI|nr:Arylsulfatase [Nesidiocoris tenuis]